MGLVLKPVHEFCCKVPTQQLATKSPRPWVLGEEHHTIAGLPCSAVSTFPPPKGRARGANGDRECPVEQAPSTGRVLFTGDM